MFQLPMNISSEREPSITQSLPLLSSSSGQSFIFGWILSSLTWHMLVPVLKQSGTTKDKCIAFPTRYQSIWRQLCFHYSFSKTFLILPTRPHRTQCHLLDELPRDPFIQQGPSELLPRISKMLQMWSLWVRNLLVATQKTQLKLATIKREVFGSPNWKSRSGSNFRSSSMERWL